MQLFRPAHKVPDTVWSSETPLNLKPRFITLFFLVLGLWIFGTGEAILIGAGIGVSPWTVLAQGITERGGFFVISILALIKPHLWFLAIRLSLNQILDYHVSMFIIT